MAVPVPASVAPIWAKPLTIVGRDPHRAVTFPVPVLLAPMEGITDQVFRDLVIGLGGVGGACTEFIRISNSAMSAKVVRRYLGPLQTACPVGVQFMAADEPYLAESIASAERVGATWIDLNFGCPVPVVFNKCAGSALLAKPERLAAIIRTAVAATGAPVSAKIRAGITDAGHLGEIVAAVVEAGAAMLTVHARLRCQAYSQPATWAWLAEAKTHLRRSGRAIPLVGNGGIDSPEDIPRMLAETGCDAAMIGRSALADPWIFRVAQGGALPTGIEAANFALRYADVIEAARGARGSIAKLKQLVRWYRAGGLFVGSEDDRQRLLRCLDLAVIRAWFAKRQVSALTG